MPNNSELGQGEFGTTEFGANQPSGGSGGSGGGSGFGAGEFGATEFGNIGSSLNVLTIAVLVTSTTGGIKELLRNILVVVNSSMTDTKIISRLIPFVGGSNVGVIRQYFLYRLFVAASTVSSIRTALKRFSVSSVSSAVSLLAFQVKIVSVSVVINSSIVLFKNLTINRAVVSVVFPLASRFISIARSFVQTSVVGYVRNISKSIATTCSSVLNVLHTIITYILPTPKSRIYHVRREQRTWIDTGNNLDT
jgi:hypothetical protein